MAPRKTATRSKISKAPKRRSSKAPRRNAPIGKSKRKEPTKKKKPAPAPRSVAALPPADPATLASARLVANAALDKKAENVVILDVRGLTSYADYFVVASGASDRQVAAIADNVDEVLRKSGRRPLGTEGYTRGHWILIDFGDIVAHVFYDEARQFYDIEGLWADAPRVAP